MSHPNPFVSDQQVVLAGVSRHVTEWIMSKCLFVPAAGYFMDSRMYFYVLDR